MKLTCPCGAMNRIPSLPTTRIRCGTCKRVFTPGDLAKAKPESPADFELDREEDLEDFDPEEDDEW